MGFTMPGLDETALAASRYRELISAAPRTSRDATTRTTVSRCTASPVTCTSPRRTTARWTKHASPTAPSTPPFRDRPGRPPETSVSRRGDFDTALSRGLIIAGNPETVRNEVQRYVDVTGANYFVGSFAYGTMTDAQLMTSVRLFAEEVMTAVPATSELGAAVCALRVRLLHHAGRLDEAAEAAQRFEAEAGAQPGVECALLPVLVDLERNDEAHQRAQGLADAHPDTSPLRSLPSRWPSPRSTSSGRPTPARGSTVRCACAATTAASGCSPRWRGCSRAMRRRPARPSNVPSS